MFTPRQTFGRSPFCFRCWRAFRLWEEPRETGNFWGKRGCVNDACWMQCVGGKTHDGWCVQTILCGWCQCCHRVMKTRILCSGAPCLSCESVATGKHGTRLSYDMPLCTLLLVGLDHASSLGAKSLRAPFLYTKKHLREEGAQLGGRSNHHGCNTETDRHGGPLRQWSFF